VSPGQTSPGPQTAVEKEKKTGVKGTGWVKKKKTTKVQRQRWEENRQKSRKDTRPWSKDEGKQEVGNNQAATKGQTRTGMKKTIAPDRDGKQVKANRGPCKGERETEEFGKKKRGRQLSRNRPFTLKDRAA